MRISTEAVEGCYRQTIPTECESIATDFQLEKIVPLIYSVSFYLRKPFDCPFNIGNWVIDLKFCDGGIYSIKLPKEMDEDRVKKYIQPLTENMINEN